MNWFQTFFCPLHMQPVLKIFQKNNYPVAERLYKYGLYLQRFKSERKKIKSLKNF